MHPPAVSRAGPAAALAADPVHLEHPLVDCVPGDSLLQPQPQSVLHFLLHRSIGPSVTFHIGVRFKNLLVAVSQGLSDINRYLLANALSKCQLTIELWMV